MRHLGDLNLAEFAQLREAVERAAWRLDIAIVVPGQYSITQGLEDAYDQARGARKHRDEEPLLPMDQG